MAKLLLAEDDLRLATLIQDWLNAENHTVEHVTDGRAALDLIDSTKFDMFMLDWDMPHVSGIEVCKQYRKTGGTVPILILTGKGAVEEKEQGLDCGADDYLTKPFHLRELSARIRALLRRPEQLTQAQLKVRDLMLDLSARRLIKNGKEVELFPKEFALLEFLMRHPNQVFSLEALQERVWPSDSESSPETIRVHIARLRSKIEADGERPIVKTVHRQGYMLDASA
jgi:DNA-binding response OmpR family regulator